MIRIGVLRTDLPIQSQEEWAALFPGEQVAFLPIFPRSPQELKDLTRDLDLDFIHLRNETLVDLALREKIIPLIMPDKEGHLVRLKNTVLDTEPFVAPTLSSNPEPTVGSSE